MERLSLDVVVLAALLTQLMVLPVTTKNCSMGRYFAEDLGDCRLCSEICHPGRGSPKKCQRHSQQCQMTTGLFGKGQQTTTVAKNDNTENSVPKNETTWKNGINAVNPVNPKFEHRPSTQQRPSTDQRPSSDQQRSTDHRPSTDQRPSKDRVSMPLGSIVATIASISSLTFLVLLTFIAIVLRRRRLLEKPILVEAVHPVDEGKGQIIPSSSTPPRLFVTTTKNTLTSSSLISFPVDYRCHGNSKDQIGFDKDYERYVNEMSARLQSFAMYSSPFESK